MGDGWRQGVVFRDLLREGTDATGMGEDDGIGLMGVKVCGGV